jgi:hypothetical protein
MRFFPLKGLRGLGAFSKNSSLVQLILCSLRFTSFIVLSGVKLHKLSEMAHILILVLVKVIAKGAALTKLRKVVVEGLLREANLLSGVLKTVSDQIPGQIVSYPIKEAAPGLNLFNDEVDAPLLGALVVLFIAQ